MKCDMMVGNFKPLSPIYAHFLNVHEKLSADYLHTEDRAVPLMCLAAPLQLSSKGELWLVA